MDVERAPAGQAQTIQELEHTFQGSILAKLAGSEQIGASQNGTDRLPSREVAIFRKLYVRGSL